MIEETENHKNKSAKLKKRRQESGGGPGAGRTRRAPPPPRVPMSLVPGAGPDVLLVPHDSDPSRAGLSLSVPVVGETPCLF